MFNIIDLFSGAGGLTEGFRESQFNFISHVEMDSAACETLLLREIYYALKRKHKLTLYDSYLSGDVSLASLKEEANIKSSAVINATISEQTLPDIFDCIDKELDNREVHGIIGGPPCQAYSTVGRSRNAAKKESDERIYLYKHYIKFLRHYHPDFFIFENVRGLLSFKDIDGQLLFPKILNELSAVTSNITYNVQPVVVDCSEYGVPQARKRLFILGQRTDKNIINFKEQLDLMRESAPTVRELFQDLPTLQAGETKNEYTHVQPCSFVSQNIRRSNAPLTWNVARPTRDLDLKIYAIAAKKKVHGKNLVYTDLPSQLQTHHNVHSFLDRFRALPYDSVSHTVVAHICKDGHYYIHPDIKQNRSITVREAARIQTFPDDFYFCNNRTAAFKQIGNAVPPYFAHKLAKIILKRYK